MYIHTRQGYKCAEVKPGDRLGVYTVVSPGSVAYNFESQQPSTKSYAYDGQNDYIPDGTEVTFDSLVYPYKFSAAAFIDTGKFRVLPPGSVTNHQMALPFYKMALPVIFAFRCVSYV